MNNPVSRRVALAVLAAAEAQPPEVGMYRAFFASVRGGRPSALSPEVALESAEIGIAEGRAVTAADF